MPKVALVTDSTASLSAGDIERCGIVVIPVQVVIGATVYDEGEHGATAQMVADALKEFVPVSTSRPGPAVMLEAYERLAAEGAEEILAIHLSAELSGTFDSADVASRQASVPVTAVDARQVGIGTGYAVLAAAAVLEAGGSVEEAATAARARAGQTTSLFYVDTLEYLRRGGRVSAASAMIGGALAVKPLLGVDDGVIHPVEKVRTAGKAIARLEELAVQAAGDRPVDVHVAHLASPDRARALADRLGHRIVRARSVTVGELGAVLGAHAGPGVVGVSVAPAID